MQNSRVFQQFGKILLFAVLAGCSGGGGGGSSSSSGGADEKVSTSVDACNLLTNAEIIAAIGVEIEKIENGETADGLSYCHYYGKDTALLQKGITVMAALGSAKERWQGHRDLVSDAVPVFDLGTEAYTSFSDPVFVALYQDKVFLSVSPLYTPTGIDWKITKPLAEKALVRALKL